MKKRKQSRKESQKAPNRNIIEREIKNWEDKLKTEIDKKKIKIYKEILQILNRDDNEYIEKYRRGK